MVLKKFGVALTLLVLVTAFSPGVDEVSSQQALLKVITAPPASWTGAEIWVSRIGDPATATNQCNSVFTSGETIHIYFRVYTPTVWVRIWDFDSDQGKVLLFDERYGVPQQVAARQIVRALSGQIQGSGWETLVLQVQTTSGIVLSTGCGFQVWKPTAGQGPGQGQIPLPPYAFNLVITTEVADVPPDSPSGAVSIAHLGINDLDRGCHSLYQTSQPVTLHYRIDDPSGSSPVPVAVYNITRQGTIQTLISDLAYVGKEYKFNAEVGGITGRNIVVLHTRLNDGQWMTSFCSMNVRETASFLEDFELGNTFRLPWRHGGHIHWFITTSWRPGQQPGQQNYVVQAGPISHNGRSILEIAFFTNQPGTLSFWYRVSSESCCDFLRFYINRNEVQRWAGEKGWAQASFYLPAGLHTLRWEYTKDSSDSGGQDTAWLDDISFMPSW